MILHPFWDCAKTAHDLMQHGYDIYQQFVCSNCGAKQTMAIANQFHKLGKCEECDHITDVEHDGCNYMLVAGRFT